MPRSIRVRILSREYPLVVQDEAAEAVARDVAAYVDGKMRAFREAHPEQSEMTTAVITALTLAEELYAAREREDDRVRTLDATLDELARTLGDALPEALDAADTPDAPSRNGTS